MEGWGVADGGVRIVGGWMAGWQARRLLTFFSPFARLFLAFFSPFFSPFSLPVLAVFLPYSRRILAVFLSCSRCFLAVWPAHRSIFAPAAICDSFPSRPVQVTLSAGPPLTRRGDSSLLRVVFLFLHPSPLLLHPSRISPPRRILCFASQRSFKRENAAVQNGHFRKWSENCHSWKWPFCLYAIVCMRKQPFSESNQRAGPYPSRAVFRVGGAAVRVATPGMSRLLVAGVRVGRNADAPRQGTPVCAAIMHH